MKFKAGDLASLNKDKPGFTDLTKGDIVTVLEEMGANIFSTDIVYRVEDYFGRRWSVLASDLDAYDGLPIGMQPELDLPCQELCDCGGYKTYGSMDPAYHSQSLPCSSLKTKVL